MIAMSEYLVGLVLAVGFLCYLDRRVSFLLAYRKRRVIWVVGASTLVAFGGVLLSRMIANEYVQSTEWAILIMQSLTIGCLLAIFALCLAYSRRESFLRKLCLRI